MPKSRQTPSRHHLSIACSNVETQVPYARCFSSCVLSSCQSLHHRHGSSSSCLVIVLPRHQSPFGTNERLLQPSITRAAPRSGATKSIVPGLRRGRVLRASARRFATQSQQNLQRAVSASITMPFQCIPCQETREDYDYYDADEDEEAVECNICMMLLNGP